MTAVKKLDLAEGRYTGIGIEEYHNELPGYSKTMLDNLALSPANMIAAKAAKSDSVALKIGRAIHTRLENHRNVKAYESIFAVEPKFNRATTVGKEGAAKFAEEAKGKTILTAAEGADVEAMFNAIKLHPVSNALLETSGDCEETFIWRDEATGVLCRCRPDKRLVGPQKQFPEGLILDWKKIATPSKGRSLEDEIKAAIHLRRYHVQAAFIADGVAKITGKKPPFFVNVFMEDGGQNRIVCAVIPEEDVQVGRELYRANLNTIKACEAQKNWWGFVEIGLPHWVNK